MNYRALKRTVRRAVVGEVRDALRKHGSVRAAAKALRMPKSTLHDIAIEHGFGTVVKRRAYGAKTRRTA